MDKTASLPQDAPSSIADSGRIKVGACGRFPVSAPAEVSDTGRVKLGGGFRLPTNRTAA